MMPPCYIIRPITEQMMLWHCKLLLPRLYLHAQCYLRIYEVLYNSRADWDSHGMVNAVKGCNGRGRIDIKDPLSNGINLSFVNLWAALCVSERKTSGFTIASGGERRKETVTRHNVPAVVDSLVFHFYMTPHWDTISVQWDKHTRGMEKQSVTLHTLASACHPSSVKSRKELNPPPISPKSQCFWMFSLFLYNTLCLNDWSTQLLSIQTVNNLLLSTIFPFSPLQVYSVSLILTEFHVSRIFTQEWIYPKNIGPVDKEEGQMWRRMLGREVAFFLLDVWINDFSLDLWPPRTRQAVQGRGGGHARKSYVTGRSFLNHVWIDECFFFPPPS